MKRMSRAELRTIVIRIDRATAKRLGERFYHGKQCDKHPELLGERYTVNGHCRICVGERAIARRAERSRRGFARAFRQRFYRGKVCSKHTELQGERYTSSGQCKLCARGLSREQYERKSKLDQR